MWGLEGVPRERLREPLLKVVSGNCDDGMYDYYINLKALDDPNVLRDSR